MWSYQRVFFGEITHEKNRQLSDISAREKWILVVMAVVTLWMGIGSPYFTRRFAAPVKMVLEQMNTRNVIEEVAAPAAVPVAKAKNSAGQAAAVNENSERLASR